VIVLQHEVAAVVAELSAAAVEGQHRRRPAGELGVELGDVAVAVHQLPAMQRHLSGREIPDDDRFVAGVGTGRVDQRPFELHGSGGPCSTVWAGEVTAPRISR
jgi:hypothetical protein